MKVGNSYYDIACDDFFYLCEAVSPTRFNPVIVQVQQITEKMIKSVAELVCVDIEKLMKSHNLRALYDAIHTEDSDFFLDRNALSTLKDYYYDTRYPGDNFVSVTKGELIEAIGVMANTITEVERWRGTHELSCQINNPHMFMAEAYKILDISFDNPKKIEL